MLFQTLIEDLNGASDADFDKRYVAQQEEAHGVAITLVKNYQSHGNDSALRELCELALPAAPTPRRDGQTNGQKRLRLRCKGNIRTCCSATKTDV
ncbi:MAG: DUF4142 domain-containing protein [Rhizomicrobium sp.]